MGITHRHIQVIAASFVILIGLFAVSRFKESYDRQQADARERQEQERLDAELEETLQEHRSAIKSLELKIRLMQQVYEIENESPSVETAKGIAAHYDDVMAVRKQIEKIGIDSVKAILARDLKRNLKPATGTEQ